MNCPVGGMLIQFRYLFQKDFRYKYRMVKNLNPLVIHFRDDDVKNPTGFPRPDTWR